MRSLLFTIHTLHLVYFIRCLWAWTLAADEIPHGLMSGYHGDQSLAKMGLGDCQDLSSIQFLPVEVYTSKTTVLTSTLPGIPPCVTYLHISPKDRIMFHPQYSWLKKSLIGIYWSTQTRKSKRLTFIYIVTQMCWCITKKDYYINISAPVSISGLRLYLPKASGLGLYIIINRIKS